MERQGSRERLGPLLLNVVGLGLSLPLATEAFEGVGFATEHAEKLAAATGPVFVTLLNLLWLRVRERPKTVLDRLGEVRGGAVSGDPTVVVLALGMLTAGVVAGIQVLLILPLDRTLNWAASHEWLAITPDNLPRFLRGFQSYTDRLLLMFWFPLTVLASIAIGKFGYHRLGQRPVRKLLSAIVLAAIVFLLIKLGFLLSVTTDLERVFESLRPNLEDAGRASAAVLLGFLVAVPLGRRDQEGFLFSRLMRAAPQEDRAAILELLEESSPNPPTTPDTTKAAETSK